MRWSQWSAAIVLLAATFVCTAKAREVELPRIDIPFTRHVLSNGLTLIVHEDPKSAQVSVDINYRVGTGDEPAGRTGISHLFEHLMFQGSEHSNRDWFDSLQPLGAGAGTANGMAYVDRTHYFETVPSGALDAILWLESDRMGHLLGAIDQATLDEQRGVVHNERRAVENTPWHEIGSNPYGPNAARLLEAIWPPGHPYSHIYIGSQQDLDGLTLAHLQDWFRKWYAPSNAVLVLAGDVTSAEAIAKVERYFGGLPAGPSITRVNRWTVPARGTRRDVMYDTQLATAAFTRVWSIAGAGLGSADADYLDLLAAVLNRKTSRLSRRLLVEERLASDLAIDVRSNEIGSQFSIRVTAMPEVDVARVESVVAQELTRMLENGPTADELQAARMSKVAELVSSVQSTSFKAALLGRHQLLLDDANGWKGSFERLKGARPEYVAAAGRRWLSDGDYVLTLFPRAGLKAARLDVDRSVGMPAMQVAAVAAPKFVRTELSNGVQVLFAQRQDAPEITMNLSIPLAASAPEERFPAGIAELAMNLIAEGTDRHDAAELSQTLAQLGASLKVSGNEEVVQLSLRTLSASFPQALPLFADVLSKPALREVDLQRLKTRQLGLLANSRSNPFSAADGVGPRLLFGPEHGGWQDERAIAAISRADVVRFHQRRIRPDRATLIVVGDLTLPALQSQLESLVACCWQRGGVTAADIAPAPPPAKSTPKSTLWLIDAPGTSQSSVQLLLPAPAHARAREPVMQLLVKLIGLRMNQNLREDKHWTYGVATTLSAQIGSRVFRLQSMVQTDRAAAALLEMHRELERIVAEPQLVKDALQGLQQEKRLGLADAWETHQEVAAALHEVAFYGLPDDYLQNYARQIAAVTPEDVSEAAASLLSKRSETWIVAGDLAKVEAEVRALKLGEVMKLADAT